MAENKVQFNLKNVHYSVYTENPVSPATHYATPVAVPGAVSISLEREGDLQEFYADGGVYYSENANNGYSGDITMAIVPDAMLKDVFGMTLESTDKVLQENSADNVKHVALLFEIDGDQQARHFVLYNCLLTRPGMASTTNTATKEPQPQTMSVTCRPDSTGRVRAFTTHETTSTVLSSWYTTVWEA